MIDSGYLKWLSNETATSWWNDSADPDEIWASLENGALGVTTNPVLISRSLASDPKKWEALLIDIPKKGEPTKTAEEIMKRMSQKIASTLEPVYHKTNRLQGYVCAQVDPQYAGDREVMLAMARRLASWAPNISVKLPVTAAGLDVLEECAAEGITVTATVSFTVSQVIAAAMRYRQGLIRAKKKGVFPGRCYAVIMVGRLDDYLREVAADRKADLSEKEIIQTGTAVVKNAYKIFTEEKYEAVLMPAGMRGAYHATDLAGGDMILSIHPKIQEMLKNVNVQWTKNISIPVEKSVVKKLCLMPEFVKAYEPEGMLPNEFVSYGVVQKTLSQFIEIGWKPLLGYMEKWR